MTPPLDRAWQLAFEGYARERFDDALCVLAAHGVGVSGAPSIAHSGSDPWTLVAGVYTGDGPQTRLLVGPVLAGLALGPADDRLSRVVDVRRGVVVERYGHGDATVEMTRFVSAARPGLVAVRTAFPERVLREPARLEAAADPALDAGRVGGHSWTRVAGDGGGIVAAFGERRRGRLADDLMAVAADGARLPEPAEALDMLAGALDAGFERLLSEHEAAWAARWRAADIVVEHDDATQRALRFALFHLMASVPDAGEAAVGARGVTGTGYRGHVFWDADVFVLPMLAATHPDAARAILEYRVRRLPAARDAAREARRAGARFPWESARSGRDVTPHAARDRAGTLVPIRTGQLEEHIVADVAWAADLYTQWTGDTEWAAGPGLSLLVETARYWMSRVRIEADGSAHIYGVIGPDEYHEPVDDNAFTNVLARWNLSRASDALDALDADGAHGVGVSEEERTSWRHVAAALVDGYHESTGVYEQFAGFNRLEPLIIADVASRRPIVADLLLGRARVHGAQVVKQADVLMLHHLVPDAVAPGSLEPNLRYYEPRTAHGSSLSPAMHAALFARAGDLDAATRALRVAIGVDLEDLTGSVVTGLHIATMGGLWQAVVAGFAGMRPRAGVLVVDPHLPPRWTALEVPVRFQGRVVRVRMTHDAVSITADGPVVVDVRGTRVTVGADGVVVRT